MRIISSWDDCSSWDPKIAELMAKYHIETIFYWPLNRINTHFTLSLDDCLDIAKRFEIGSHTSTHALLTRIDPAIANREIVLSRGALQGIFRQPINSFCYPRGYANDQIRDMVRLAGYTNARNTLVGSIDEPEDPIWTSVSVHVGCNRREYGDMGWLEYGLQKLKEAQTKDGIFSFFGHGEEMQKHHAWEALETLLEATR